MQLDDKVSKMTLINLKNRRNHCIEYLASGPFVTYLMIGSLTLTVNKSNITKISNIFQTLINYHIQNQNKKCYERIISSINWKELNNAKHSHIINTAKVFHTYFSTLWNSPCHTLSFICCFFVDQFQWPLNLITHVNLKNSIRFL